MIKEEEIVWIIILIFWLVSEKEKVLLTDPLGLFVVVNAPVGSIEIPHTAADITSVR